MEMSMEDTKDIQLHRAILNELGYDINLQSTILDFGCGEGKRVYQYRSLGFNAFGADIKLTKENYFLRRIHSSPVYGIPFNDETFDFVFSEQVFEHVQDHSSVLAEICRILKSGGFSLHIFPSKYKPIEPHVFVPFGGIFQAYTWLLLWALVGVKNSFQKSLGFREVTDSNHKYLKNQTCYLSKRRIRSLVLTHFRNITFAERYLIKHSYGRARYIHPLIAIFPFFPLLYSSLHCRVIFFKKM
jgi:SAM-dependent methyltransferase